MIKGKRRCKMELTKRYGLALMGALISVGLVACGTPAETPGTPDPAASSAPASPSTDTNTDTSTPDQTGTSDDLSVKFAEVAPIVEQRCAACHAENPSITRFGKPAGNVLLETPAQIQEQAARIKARAVQTQGMPVANMTNMTESERELLGRWIDEGASIE